MKADAQGSRHNYPTPLPCERNLTVQYLVMQNRIINLAYRDVEINQPMPRSTDKRHRVNASDPERKISQTLFQGSLEECQRFIDALGRALDYTGVAVPIHVVIESMHPSTDENDNA